MLTTVCQRWRSRRDLYRPAGEPIATQHYEVASIADDETPKSFVVEHHYSACYPAAVFRAGLFRTGGELVGVVVLSRPISQAALDKALPFQGRRAELGRLVLLDDVPANGESWFVARAFELARRAGFEAIVSHSDPAPRTNIDGHVVFAGHVGTVYQALNAVHTGRANAATLRLLPDGRVFSNDAWGKLRLKKRGWRYAAETLLSYGAPEPSGDWREWVTLAVNLVTRPMRHPGNLRYVWALDKRLRRHLPEGKAYPKFESRAA